MNAYLRGTLFFLVLAGLGTEFYFGGRVLKRRFDIEAAMLKWCTDRQWSGPRQWPRAGSGARGHW